MAISLLRKAAALAMPNGRPRTRSRYWATAARRLPPGPVLIALLIDRLLALHDAGSVAVAFVLASQIGMPPIERHV